MDGMKGQPRTILYFERDRGRVQLVSYPDESWGILNAAGGSVCTWEPDELPDCLRTFLLMAGGEPRLRGGSAVLAMGGDGMDDGATKRDGPHVEGADGDGAGARPARGRPVGRTRAWEHPRFN